MLYTIRDLIERIRLVVAGRSVLYASPENRRIGLGIIAQVGVSAIVLISGLLGLFSDALGADEKKYFAGLVGTVVGYWLR